MHFKWLRLPLCPEFSPPSVLTIPVLLRQLPFLVFTLWGDVPSSSTYGSTVPRTGNRHPYGKNKDMSPDNAYSVAFSQRSSKPHLIEDETFNDSLLATKPLLRLVEGEEKWEAPDHPQGVVPLNRGGTEQNRSVTRMMLKAKANDRRKTLALHCDEFRGP
ncbi:hypothetical protein TNCV_1054221 [Trichonephila clavipes]|nr:hypothetical protein TNCV_1054221 [Trichonephila clavipes]